MSETEGTEVGQSEPTVNAEWEPGSEPLSLEIGLSGVCNECQNELTPILGEDTRLQCPDCGYIAGLVIRFPTLQDGGGPGEVSDWQKIRRDWEIDDGRASFDLFVRGQHVGCGEFVQNAADKQFGTPGICCDNCAQSFGAVYQINTLVDPVNGENHLE